MSSYERLVEAHLASDLAAQKRDRDFARRVEDDRQLERKRQELALAALAFSRRPHDRNRIQRLRGAALCFGDVYRKVHGEHDPEPEESSKKKRR